MRRMGRIPARILDRVERAAARAQGKGSGAFGVEREVDAIRSLLPGSPEVRTVLDVGANRGLWVAAALAAFPRAEVHAFEPADVCVDELRRRFASESRVSIVPTAVGATEGSAVLYSDEPGSGLASLTRRQLDHVGLELDHEAQVPVTTLDAYAALHGIERVDVVKIDVEGHELDVLKGASGVLGGVSAVQFEFGGTAIDTRTYFRDYWYLFTAAGFSLWRIGPWAVQRIERYSEAEENFACTNFVAVRR